MNHSVVADDGRTSLVKADLGIDRSQLEDVRNSTPSVPVGWFRGTFSGIPSFMTGVLSVPDGKRLVMTSAQLAFEKN